MQENDTNISSIHDVSPKSSSSDLQLLLTAAGIPSCDFRVERHNAREEKGLVHGDLGVRKAKSNNLYCIGSLTHWLIVAGLYFTISQSEWEKDAFDLFNEYRLNAGKSTIEKPQGRTTSLYELLSHVRGFPGPESGRFLFGPDGSSICGVETFLNISPTLFAKGNVEGYERSMANSVFAGLLLELIVGKPLHQTLQEMVLDKLDMRDTVVTAEQFRLRRDRGEIAPGYMNFEDQLVHCPPRTYFGNAVQLSARGAYSTTADFMKLMRTISQLTFEEDLTARCHYLYDGQDSTATPFGIRASTSSHVAWSQTLASGYPDSVAQKLHEGLDEAITAFGEETGYSCFTCALPKLDLKLVVFADSVDLNFSANLGVFSVVKKLLRNATTASRVT